VTDNSGNTVAEYEYRPFGSDIGMVLNNSQTNTNYRFTGQEFDAENQLYYYNARYYNPITGRFISRDPVLIKNDGAISFNQYAYARNNPVRYTDPSGEFLDIFIDAVFIVMDVGILIYDEVANDGENRAVNIAALSADAICAIIPGFTGGGIVARVGAKTAVKQVVKTTGKQAVKNTVKNTAKTAITKTDDIAKYTKRWKVGDPINAPTKNGYPSWSTSRSRFWKNEAASNPNKYSKSNLDKMKKGNAPQQKNPITGKPEPKELHHNAGRDIPDPHNQKNLKPVWPDEHAVIDPFRHTGNIVPSFSPNLPWGGISSLTTRGAFGAVEQTQSYLNDNK